MALSKNIHTYSDVHQILTTADRYGGGSFRSPTSGKATYLRMRMNQYRALLREQHNIGTFDHFVFRPSPEDSCVTLIEIARPEGSFITPDGREVNPELTSPDDLIKPALGFVTPEGEDAATNELEEIASDLAARLKSGESPL